MIRTSRSLAAQPNPYAGRRIVVSGGSKNSAIGMSSKPTIARSSGIRRPARFTARSAPVATTSLATNTALGRALLAFLGGNLRHGQQLASRALQRYPQRNAAGSVLRFNRARCLFDLGQLAAARRDVEQALAPGLHVTDTVLNTSCSGMLSPASNTRI